MRHLACLGVAGKHLVDGVVNDLVDHVVEARAIIGIADVHARTLTHRVEAFQHLDAILAVLFGAGVFAAGCALIFGISRGFFV